MCRPVAGSLTEARGQKANIHVYKEILELCYVIDSEGEIYSEKSPQLKAIPFGELFNVKLKKIIILYLFPDHEMSNLPKTDLRTD